MQVIRRALDRHNHDRRRYTYREQPRAVTVVSTTVLRDGDRIHRVDERDLARAVTLRPPRDVRHDAAAQRPAQREARRAERHADRRDDQQTPATDAPPGAAPAMPPARLDTPARERESPAARAGRSAPPPHAEDATQPSREDRHRGRPPRDAEDQRRGDSR